jgi:hypothetical protein
MNNPEEVVQWLMDHHVPSIGPQFGMALVRIARTIEESGEMPDDVREYYNALMLVTTTSAHHQGAVIAKLGALVGEG